MAEDEAERLVHRKQPLLVLHDEVVNVVVGLGVAPGVLQHALLVLREVAVVQASPAAVSSSQDVVARVLRQRGQLRLEPLRELALDRLAGRVVVAVVGHAVDEEQAQHLDAPPAKLQFLVQVLLDRVPDLHAPDIVAHSTDFLADPQRAPVGEADELGSGSALISATE